MAKDMVRNEWQAVAGGWRRWEPMLQSFTWPMSLRMVTAAAIGPGQRVLDVGCGMGDPTLQVAVLVGPHGRVLGIDVAEGMIATAREGAHAAADRPRGAGGVPSLPGRRARQGARRRGLPGRRPGAGGALVVCARPGRVLGGDGRHGGAARVAAGRSVGGGTGAGEARGNGGDREVSRRRRLPHPRAGAARVGAGVGSRAAAPAVAPNYQAGSG